MNKKNIIHIAEDISITSGGLRTMITKLDSYLNTNETQSKIITLKKDEQDKYNLVDSKPNFWNYSTNYKNETLENLKTNSLLHLHGVWMYPQFIASKISQEKNIPAVITAHGMLEPYLLNDKKIKKKIYLNLILKNVFNRVSAIHAITQNEKDNLYKISKHKNIIEIPNLIDFRDDNNKNTYKPLEEEYILYLGRFHKVKGLELLIESFEKVDNKKIKLYLAGFQNDYCDLILGQIKSKGLQNRIKYFGEVIGEEKSKLFSNAKALVTPSYSEVIGMVNLEAASMGTPVITTYNTGLLKEWNNNGGFLINPNHEELIKTLNVVCNMNELERNQRGDMLHDFVLENYSWQKKGKLWDELYSGL